MARDEIEKAVDYLLSEVKGSRGVQREYKKGDSIEIEVGDYVAKPRGKNDWFGGRVTRVVRKGSNRGVVYTDTPYFVKDMESSSITSVQKGGSGGPVYDVKFENGELVGVVLGGAGEVEKGADAIAAEKLKGVSAKDLNNLMVTAAAAVDENARALARLRQFAGKFRGVFDDEVDAVVTACEEEEWDVASTAYEGLVERILHLAEIAGIEGVD